jgi:DNA-binding phage protein
MRGVTIPRPVHVRFRTHIGKEITVDPTDTDEDYTAEMLSATDVLEYHDEREKLNSLRAEIRALGVNAVARESGVSPSRVQAFVNEGARPHPETIAKLRRAADGL